jgi:hypothetical protein
MAKFKVRRDLLAMKAATFTKGVTASSTLDVTLGVTAASTVAVTGGIAATSTLTVGGAAQFGSGTSIVSILAGSLTLSGIGDMDTGTSRTVNACIPGMSSSGQYHKIIIQPMSTAACMLLSNVAASADDPEGVCSFTFWNSSGACEGAVAGTANVLVSYFAVLDR